MVKSLDAFAPTTAILELYHQETATNIRKVFYTKMFITLLFIVAKKGKR